jgi:hypothetical protein
MMASARTPDDAIGFENVSRMEHLACLFPSSHKTDDQLSPDIITLWEDGRVEVVSATFRFGCIAFASSCCELPFGSTMTFAPTLTRL